MNKVILGLCILFPAFLLSSTSITNNRPKLTPAQRKAKIQLAMMKRHGGLIRDTRSMRGSITIFNAQSKVKTSDLLSYIDEVNETVRFNIKFSEWNVDALTFEKVNDFFKKSNAQVGIFIVDSIELPGLLIAPENLWAIINVNRYGDEKLSLRVGRELARAIVMVGGGFGDGFSNSLLGPITDPAQLDSFKSSRVSYEVAGRMVNYLDPIGIRPFNILTYREACKLGFAPNPTNQYQETIWKEVHSEKERGPVNALQIPMPHSK